MKLWSISLLIGISLSFLSTGNSQTLLVDSIENLVEQERTPSKRVDLLNQAAYFIYNTNDSIGLIFSQRALEEALDVNYKAGIKYAYIMLGIGYMSKGEYDLAIKHYSKSQNVIVSGADSMNVYAMVLNANVYRDLSRYDSARLLYQKSLDVAEKIVNKRWLALTYKNLALMEVRQWKNKEAIEHAFNALAHLSNKKSTLEVEVLSALGDAYLNLNMFDSASFAFNRMCDLSGKQDYFNQIQCLLQWARYEERLGNFSEALYKAFEAVKLTTQYNYPPQVVDVYLTLGNIQIALSNYELAARYLYEGIKIAERHQLRNQIAALYGELSWVYKDLKDYEKALELMEQSLRIREKITDEYGIAKCYNAFGIIYLQQGLFDDAIQALERALSIRKSINHQEGVSACLHNLALVYEAKVNMSKAIELHQQAMVIDNEIGDKQSIGMTLNSMGQILLKQGKIKEALSNLTKAQQILVETKSKLHLLKNYKLMVDCYVASQDFERSYQFQKRYQSLNDTIYATSSRTRLTEMEVLYQLEQRDQQITVLQQQRDLTQKELELQRSEITLQRIFILSGILGILLLVIIARNFYKSKKVIQLANREITEQKEEIQAQSEELVEANQTIAEINRSLEVKVEMRTSELKQAYTELDTFFYRSSHDFRRPLTTFMGLAEVAKVTVKDPNALELFAKVKETAVNLDKMLVKLQSISDVGGQEMVYKEVLWREIFDTVTDQYRDLIKSVGMDIKFEQDLKSEFRSYPAMIKIILENLLENSLHFATTSHPYLQVKVFENGSGVQLVFKDNGQGIDEEYQNRIFEMYFRANHLSKGNGLGLYIVKKAVDKLKGNITLLSEKNSGTTFTISLPLT